MGLQEYIAQDNDRLSVGKKVSVLIVDDSALVRKMLTEIISRDPQLTVVGSAVDALDAREKIKQLNPDVITLDVEMPGMDGVQFLRNLMRLRPMPVVMISTMTTHGADVTLDALDVGAVDCISKPRNNTVDSFDRYEKEVLSKIKIASQANIRPYRPGLAPQKQAHKGSAIGRIVEKKRAIVSNKIIAIGSSTGGTEALKEVITRFPENMPPVLITQHIPPGFSKSFAERMDSLCAMSVSEAEDGQEVVAGHVYIAPGDKHLRLAKRSGRYYCVLDDGPSINQHKPSVGALFDSVNQSAGHNAIAVMLTGMGDDGAREMRRMHEQGVYTFAQDEATSVVWGMPGQAVKRGAVDEIVPLREIADKIMTKIGIH